MATLPQLLAEQVRKGEMPFIEAMSQAIYRRIAAEYHRLRGYSIEAGSDTMRMTLTIECDFTPEHPRVTVLSTPQFIPATGSTTVKVAL